jgi:hypothetical protein
MKLKTTAILVAILLSGCVQTGTKAQSDGFIPLSAMKPAANTGLIVPSQRFAANDRVPSFGVAPGNSKGVLPTIAGLAPDEVAPIFARVKAEHQMAVTGTVTSINSFAGGGVDLKTVRTASDIICRSIGASLFDITGLADETNPSGPFEIQCK